MLYLESPAGVGFSYTEEDDYKTSDAQTAVDNHLALRDFFRKFPHLAGNELYLTGQSYGGIYVPTLGVRLMADSGFNLKVQYHVIPTPDALRNQDELIMTCPIHLSIHQFIHPSTPAIIYVIMV